MAKQSYKIPAPLNRNYLDHEITFNVAGWQFPPSPLKQILFLVGGVMFTAWAASSTFIKTADPLLIAFFVVWSLIMVFYLGGLTKTKELRLMTVPALLAYVPRKARRVTTRQNADPSDFYSIVGIDDISENGRISFSDGRVGQAFLVVGSASYLLFAEDQEAILNRVDSYWQKVDTRTTHAFITTKESQRIYHQIAHLERLNQNLVVRDPDLLELLNEQYDILTEHVGGKFTSIHQYVLLIGKSMDGFKQGLAVLESEVDNSSLMIKETTMLDREETTQMLRVFYQSNEQLV